MTQLFFADCVRETSLSSGTEAFSLDGAVSGHRAFASVVPPNTPFHYAISGISHEDEWEVGEGILDEEGQLVRSALSSSNAGALVPFSAGLKTVALTVASDWFSNQGAVGIDDVEGLAIALDGKQPVGDYAAAEHGHSQFLQLNGSGNLGLGTASPTQRLHIVDSTPNEGSLRLGNHASYYGSIRYQYSTGALILGTGPGQGEFYGNYHGHFYPGADNVGRCGLSSNRWNIIFAASGTVNTSDARAKRDFDDIPDVWLDAWGNVHWQRYRFTKGTRWHVGLIAQQVYAAFAEQGVDAFTIGLCCFDSWDAEQDGQGNVLREAGDRWGLRYDECFAMEAAWHRRETRRLSERLAAVEQP